MAMTLTREEVGGDQGVFERVSILEWFKRHGRLLLAAGLAAGVFVVDVRLPRTAIPAICYSGILALVASSGVRRIIMPCALLFTALTWAGAVLEPAPAPAEAGALWASVIDRAMVSGVLWLTALLMLRREQSLAELEKLSRELARRNAELDQFAGVVAHDVRSPLATASLYAQLLERTDPADREEVAQCHEVIARSLGEMEELIRDLLEATRRPQERADCDTQAVLNRVVRTMQGELIQSGARVKFDGLPMVHADEGQVRQVFQNLIQNAIKYRSPQREPEIVVTAELDGSEGARMWRFCVADNGLGVKPEDASRIFERFGRGTGASGRASGVGLGLAVCKRIVEQHGGRIWVETPPAPAEQGQVGARFCFTLPSSET